MYALQVPNALFNVSQPTPKINPVSKQMLQTLNRDPRLRKVEIPTKSLSTSNNDVKQTTKSKEDKKLDKSKRESNKHRDSKRKERSPSHSPSKKEVPKKSHKKIDRKERSPRDDKYHKRKDDKKIKGLEAKKKSTEKVLHNEIVLKNCDTSLKDDKKLFKEELKSVNPSSDLLDLPIIKPIETNVPTEKNIAPEKTNENEANDSGSTISELVKTDSLEDSDSLKRLRIYMQTMKKSPEPSPALSDPLLDLKNDSNTCAVKSNQSKIKMSDQLFFIIKFIVGEFLLFLNILIYFLRHIKMKIILPFHILLYS